MHASIQYDASISVVAIGISILIYTLIISVIEALVMFLLKWDKFRRSLWISLLMNVASTIFGFAVLSGFVGHTSVWLLIAIGFVISVLIEFGILMFTKRDAQRLNWLTSLIANITSYSFIILPLAWIDMGY